MPWRVSDLDFSIVLLLGGPIPIFLFLPLQEPAEVVLDQEGGVEFPHRDLIIWKGQVFTLYTGVHIQYLYMYKYWASD